MNINLYAAIICYWDGIAICEDDFGDLWYAEIPEACAELGSVVEMDMLTAFSELPKERQNEILREITPVLGKGEVT